MAFCPYCGSAAKEGEKFCTHCGKPLASVPVNPQPAQPQQPVNAQPVNAQPINPQPVNAQPVNPQPVYPQPAQAAPKKNGMCTTGFILSLLGIFLFGITSLFGLIFSVFGLISAKKKNQDGTGKAVAGIIMSVSMIVLLLVIFVFLRNPILDKYEELTGRTFPTRKVTIQYDKWITEAGWVMPEDESSIHFDEKKHTFNHYVSYLETTDYYYGGSYELYTGNKAANYLQKKLGDDNMSEDDVEWLLESKNNDKKNNLIVIVCKYSKMVYEGKVQYEYEVQTRRYYGFYEMIDEGGELYEALRLYCMEKDQWYVFINEDQYDDYRLGMD